jgi:hypothetical protein
VQCAIQTVYSSACMTVDANSKTDLLIYLCYKVSAYVVLNLGEDAALVAFMFC